MANNYTQQSSYSGAIIINQLENNVEVLSTLKDPTKGIGSADADPYESDTWAPIDLTNVKTIELIITDTIKLIGYVHGLDKTIGNVKFNFTKELLGKLIGSYDCGVLLTYEDGTVRKNIGNSLHITIVN